jgi:hypothetical protein
MPRFFAIDGNDVIAFGSREEIDGYLEAYDVASYRFFAEDGVELRLGTKDYRVIVTDEQINLDPDYLTERLRDSLRAVPVKRRIMSDPAVNAAALPELVEEMLRLHDRYEK